MAHDFVDSALAVGQNAIDFFKKRPGIVKWTVDKIEPPAARVLDTKLARTALKIGDRAVSVADGTIDRAMKTAVYKTSSHVIKDTFRRALELADASVEYMLPADATDKTEYCNPKAESVMGLTRKLSVRATHSINQVCSRIFKRALVFRDMMLKLSRRYVTAVDKLLLKYKHTAALRNSLLSWYSSRLAPMLSSLASKVLGTSLKAQPIRKVHKAVPVPAPVPALKNLPTTSTPEAAMSAPRLAVVAENDGEAACGAGETPGGESGLQEKAVEQSVSTPRTSKKSKVT